MSFPGALTVPTVVTGDEVEEAIVNTLKLRLPYYLNQIGYVAPKSYSRVTTFDNWPENQLPAIICICAGIEDSPMRKGDGTFIAKWLVGCAALVSAKTEDETRVMARKYGALIRATILQSPSLTPVGFSRGVEWVNETYDQVDMRDRRTLASAEVVFRVEVDEVVNAHELPYMPEMEGLPNPTGITPDSVIIEVNPREEQE